MSYWPQPQSILFYNTPLSHIFNASFDTVLPKDFKLAKVIPVIKVTILFVLTIDLFLSCLFFSKIFEKLVLTD